MMCDLNEMAQNALATARKREKKGQLESDTMSILKHCAGEVCEATDAYARWCEIDNEIFNKSCKEAFSDELADIITCVLIVAAQEDIDINAALLRVQEKNARRCNR